MYYNNENITLNKFKQYTSAELNFLICSILFYSVLTDSWTHLLVLPSICFSSSLQWPKTITFERRPYFIIGIYVVLYTISFVFLVICFSFV